ncbi:hypothetical protein ACBQ24_12445 [Acinetobacter terrestris]|uniref:hypothetical protein n=1 Tax=Acinetobacter terrestris TaxID=2529843 RepID=UPI00103C8F3C|nr:hypothetical protein [Acinetobacter terrestris]TCB50279.1 hypothetical protein E0H84_15060 [Acinetobacter terrestris]
MSEFSLYRPFYSAHDGENHHKPDIFIGENIDALIGGYYSVEVEGFLSEQHKFVSFFIEKVGYSA